MPNDGFTMDTGSVVSAGGSLLDIAGSVGSARTPLGATGAEDYADVQAALTDFSSHWDGELSKLQGSISALGSTTQSIGTGVAANDADRAGIFRGKSQAR